MIKLKAPLNWKGGLFEAGKVVSLPSELETAMIEAGTAERFIHGIGAAEPVAPIDPEPELEPVPDHPEPKPEPEPEPEQEPEKKKSSKKVISNES